jgi:hypothetical protein
MVLRCSNLVLHCSFWGCGAGPWFAAECRALGPDFGHNFSAAVRIPYLFGARVKLWWNKGVGCGVPVVADVGSQVSVIPQDF